MQSSETNTQPPFYDEIFVGYMGLAATRGLISHEPLNPHSDPGDDGTLTPDGEQAFTYTYEVGQSDMPSAIQQLGIDSVLVEYHSRKVYDGSDCPERVAIELHEEVGAETSYQFERESEQVSAYDVQKYMDNDSSTEKPSELSEEEKVDIMIDLREGRTHWLELEGPSGEFARSLHLLMEFHDNKPTAADTDKLLAILAALNPAS